MSRRRILIDVDGVLGNFVASAITLINNRLDKDFTYEDVTSWDVFKTLGLKESEHILEEAVEHERFCKNIVPYPGAREAVEFIEKEFGNVYAVTSPYHGKNWMGERAEWLVEHMGISRKHQVHTKSKHLVAGCVLIDDGPKNLQTWDAHWHSGLPILIDQPWNREETRFARTRSWEEVFENIEQHLQTTGKEFV